MGPFEISSVVIIVLVILTVLIAGRSVRVVPQSDRFVIERFGKYTKTLKAGLNLIVPFLDKVAFKISILERQLDEFDISVITKDNVEVNLETTNFYRVLDAAKSVYRIRDVNKALRTAAESIVRSAAGKLELDELQSSREAMNQEILSNLQGAAEIWGIEITRTEITDVRVDEETKSAQRQQMNAERERRATVAKAEGEKSRVELSADAQLYQAQRSAEAVKVTADAEAYSVRVIALAEAEQTRVIATAISENGQPAVDFEILKRQVEAIGVLASSENSKTIVVPTDVTKTIGSLALLKDLVTK
jgi:regulator of protease activity HflC (stomatin/prohibitin superfamily)